MEEEEADTDGNVCDSLRSVDDNALLSNDEESIHGSIASSGNGGDNVNDVVESVNANSDMLLTKKAATNSDASTMKKTIGTWDEGTVIDEIRSPPTHSQEEERTPKSRGSGSHTAYRKSPLPSAIDFNETATPGSAGRLSSLDGSAPVVSQSTLENITPQYPDFNNLTRDQEKLLSGSEDEDDPWVEKEDPFAPGTDDEDDEDFVHEVQPVTEILGVFSESSIGNHDPIEERTSDKDVEIEGATSSQLKLFCRQEGLRVGGNKSDLKARVYEHMGYTVMKFVLKEVSTSHTSDGGGNNDEGKWVLIEGEDIDSGPDVTPGYYGPTNRRNLPSQKTQRFFGENTINRPTFIKLEKGLNEVAKSYGPQQLRRRRRHNQKFCRKRIRKGNREKALIRKRKVSVRMLHDTPTAEQLTEDGSERVVPLDDGIAWVSGDEEETVSLDSDGDECGSYPSVECDDDGSSSVSLLQKTTDVIGGPTNNFHLDHTSSPIEYFDLMLTPQFRHQVLTNCTNMRAAMEGAGSKRKDPNRRTNYPDFLPFDREEIDSFLGLLLVNGISPKPRLEYWFLKPHDSKVYGNDFISRVFPRGAKRLAEFRRFFCMYDPRISPQSEIAKRTLFKVRFMLDHLQESFKKWWMTGRDISIDEQTLGFQGRHGSKLRITFKRVGDGFMCDALCDQGYTYAFYFRCDDPPTSGHNLCATSERVIWLLRQLNTEWSHVHMDNLFNNVKLARAAYCEKALVNGVVRTNNKGIAAEIIQKEVKTKARQDEVRGTVKVAVRVGDPICPNIIACSIYDTKPVHVLSTVGKSVEWWSVQSKVWSEEKKKLVKIFFKRLNLIHLYNHGMGHVDIADQLRLQYRPCRWMRNRKWWWAFFLWGLGVSVTNAYCLYRKIWEIACKKKKKMEGGRELTHLQFVEKLSLQLLFPNVKMMNVQVSRVTSRALHDINYVPLTQFRIDSVLDVRVRKVTEASLRDYFPQRFDGQYHPFIAARSRRPCQLCLYKGRTHYDKLSDGQKRRFLRSKGWKELKDGGHGARKLSIKDQMRKSAEAYYRNCVHVSRCVTCNVELCSYCFGEFHGQSI